MIIRWRMSDTLMVFFLNFFDSIIIFNFYFYKYLFIIFTATFFSIIKTINYVL